MIVTIDGPAGAGKSSAARRLARRLGFGFLDTGAMYRAVVWAALDQHVPLDDSDALEALVDRLRVDVSERTVRVDGRDVSAEIRRPRVGELIHHVADNRRIRDRLVQWQRQRAAGADIVTEGRDQGTVAFPDADCKIFLTASREERARRRLRELQDRRPASDETPPTFEQVLSQQDARDRRDRERLVGGLREADDAVIVQTDGLTPDQVVETLEDLVRQAATKRAREA